jgi:hypothetical protein
VPGCQRTTSCPFHMIAENPLPTQMVTKDFFIVFFLHHFFIKTESFHLLLPLPHNHLPLHICPLFRINSQYLLSALYEVPKIVHPLTLYPQYGNCSVCLSVGHFLTFDEAHPQKPKSHTGLRYQKRNDKNYI